MKINYKSILITVLLLIVLGVVFFVETGMFISGPQRKYEDDIRKMCIRDRSETLRNDRKLIVTTNAPLQEELMRKDDGMCRDFLALGGEYGFLYYEVLYEDEKEALVRQQLEKEINDLLYPMSIARTMGGAVGEYYSYIDIAVFDKDGFMIALEKINEHMNFKIYYKSFL